MKNINMKKIVAGAGVFAVSALFAGAVAAANVADDTYTPVDNLTKSQLFGATGPAYNVIVGSMAQPVDVVWAGNIAAAIGKKAYTTGDAIAGAALESVTVTAGAESTSTVSGDGKLFDDDAIGTQTTLNAASLSDTDYSILFDDDVEIENAAGNDVTLNNVNEKIDFDGVTVSFNNDEDVDALLLNIPANSIVYTLDLGDGIEKGLTVGGDHDITIPFLGKMYDVRSTSSTGDEIVLVSQENTNSYEEGVSFEVVGDGSYDGQTLTVEIGTISSGTNNSVLLKLLDSTGAQIASETVDNGDDVDFDGKIEEFTVVGVYYTENSTSYVEISAGADTLTLEDNEEVDEFTDAEGREWEIGITAGTYITQVTLTNTDGWDEVPKDGDEEFPQLVVGESALFPATLGSLDFIGLEDKTMYTLETDNGVVKWVDSSDDAHEVPMFEEKSDDSDIKLKIDGKDYFFKYNSDDTVSIYEGTNDEGDLASGTIYVQDFNTSSDSDGSYIDYDLNNLPIGVLDFNTSATADANMSYFSIDSDIDGSALYFALVDDSTSWGVALSSKLPTVDTTGEVLTEVDLDTVTGIYDLSTSSLKWEFVGTDASSDLYYFNGFASEETEIAKFSLDDGSSKYVHFYIDPETQALADTEDYTSPNYNHKVEFANASSSSVTWNLDDEDDSDIDFGITTRGTEVSIASGEVVIDQPDEVRNVKIFVGGGSTSSTTINGATFTLTAEGEAQTEDGVSVSLDNVTLSGGAATDAIVPMTWNVATNKLVYLDNENPAGNKIIVGGHLVNTLAENMGLDTLLTASGDYVLGQNAEGNIVVAGMTADDTAMAAKELINVIENM